MSQEDVVALVIRACDQAGLTHMVVGSFASNYHGVPRMTQDDVVVVAGSLAQILGLVKLLESDFYASEVAAREAFAHRKLFNAIHLDTGFKVDLIVKQTRPFSDEELARKRAGTMGGAPASFATAEDTFLTKLEWARQGDSERQYDDAAGIARVQGDRLDWSYIDRWSADLAVTDLVARARAGKPFRE